MKSINRESGFTLVEIAIVLVVIGLLLGGVLKGQEMIENAKIKNLRSDFEGVSAAFYAYQDRYNVIPGDDVRAASRGWADAVAGNGNGVLPNNDAFFNGGAGTNETALLWQHLRYASLISGDPANPNGRVNPIHSFSGKIGVTGLSTNRYGGGMTGLAICASLVPGKAASSIDAALDDGMPNRGSIRGHAATNINSEAATTAATSYDESLTYTMCKRM